MSDATVPWSAIVEDAAAALAASDVDNARVEARWIVADAAGLTDAEFDAHGDEPATVGGVRRTEAMVSRRCSGEPLQYVLGHWAFRSLDVLVDPRVLIPRPETEQVVERVLAELDRLDAVGLPRDDEGTRRVVDLGTGSGVIALAVATERPAVRVVATDVSTDALAVAAANLAGAGTAAARVQLAHGSWFDALDDRFASLRGAVDVVVSNPPYIADDEDLPADVVDHEPTSALFSGPAGTEFVVAVLEGAVPWLRPGGVVVVELAPHQADTMVAVASGLGYVDVGVGHDLAGRPRCVVARRPPPVSPDDR